MTDEGALARREVVIGCNSKLWCAAAADSRVAARFRCVISHRDVAAFAFEPADRVWLFSYSRVPAENSRLLQALQAAGVSEVIYVSSVSTIVTRVTQCYEYPRVKKLAEDEARKRLDARILTLGVVCDSPTEQPAGIRVVTWQSQLNDFMLAPSWPNDGGTRMLLFGQAPRLPAGRLEAGLQRVYGWLIRCTGSWPCLLRPLDMLLRFAGVRWYGYVYLSDRLWNSTRS